MIVNDKIYKQLRTNYQSFKIHKKRQSIPGNEKDKFIKHQITKCMNQTQKFFNVEDLDKKNTRQSLIQRTKTLLKRTSRTKKQTNSLNNKYQINSQLISFINNNNKLVTPIPKHQLIKKDMVQSSIFKHKQNQQNNSQNNSQNKRNLQKTNYSQHNDSASLNYLLGNFNYEKYLRIIYKNEENKKQFIDTNLQLKKFIDQIKIGIKSTKQKIHQITPRPKTTSLRKKISDRWNPNQKIQPW